MEWNLENMIGTADPAGECPGPEDGEELLLMQADGENAPLRTWSVPEVCDIGRCIRDWYFPRILQEMNARLAAGELSELLGQAVVSERIGAKGLRLGTVACWRLNRTDFLADVALQADLDVESGGTDVSGTFRFIMVLWFCTEEGFGFEVQELLREDSRPERSLWKLDRHLVPVLRRDEIETGADRLWESWLPGKKDPKERTAVMLAQAMGLSVRELRLYGQNRTRAVLFFQDGFAQVQEEPSPGDPLPAPVPVPVAAGTVVLNTAASCREKGGLEILHECVHYDWHLLFYRLQKAASSSPLEFRMKQVRASAAYRPANPLRWMEQQADDGALALLLPRGLMRTRAWRLYQEASARPCLNGYFNHPGFRWDHVIRRLADEYGASRLTVRRRLVMLGHPAAKGAVNYLDGGYITPFAFSPEHSGAGGDTLVISRKDLSGLYRRSPRFRELMETGDFVRADGHVCLNDPQYVRRAGGALALTPWANAHVDACCLRFGRVRLPEREESVLVFSSLNSSAEYDRGYNEYLDRRMSMTAAQRAEKRDRLMKGLPNDYPDALRYLMENADGGRITVEQLAARAMVSSRTVTKYRSGPLPSYNPDVAVALCLAMHLPPWLSRVLLNKAGVPVRNYGPRGHYGEILDCCFMDTLPQVQEYLKAAGLPPLKLQEE